MANTRYATQYKKTYVDKPAVPADSGVLGGAVKCLSFEYNLATLGVVLADDDVIKCGVLPKGARPLEAYVESADLGTTGVANLGWAASAELSAGVTVEAAVEAGFISGIDCKDASADNRKKFMSAAGGAPGMLKKFSGAVDVQLQMSEATSGTTGIIKGYVAYVVE